MVLAFAICWAVAPAAINAAKMRVDSFLMPLKGTMRALMAVVLAVLSLITLVRDVCAPVRVVFSAGSLILVAPGL